MTTTASINAKGCSSTGITEELAKRCHDSLGKKVLAIVELVAEAREENRSGDEKVKLSILTIEPAPNGQCEDHLRELSRSFQYERRLAEGEAPTLPMAGQASEPDVETVLAAGSRHRPHPYLSSTLSVDDDAICDVCGQLEDAAVHGAASALSVVPDYGDEADEDQDEEDDEEEPVDDEPDDPDGDEPDDEPATKAIFDPFA